MAMVMLAAPACTRDGGLKSNFAGIRCTKGAVDVVFFEELHAARSKVHKAYNNGRVAIIIIVDWLNR